MAGMGRRVSDTFQGLGGNRRFEASRVKHRCPDEVRRLRWKAQGKKKIAILRIPF
ncbi:hypothetical protein LINPERHAP1_LOCUS37420 [Linum perenne]